MYVKGVVLVIGVGVDPRSEYYLPKRNLAGHVDYNISLALTFVEIRRGGKVP